MFALFLLFFLQMAGMWIESMYRISLVHLGPGRELYGILLLLLAFVVWVAGEKHERILLYLAVAVFLVSRLLCPHMGTAGRIITGGVGVSMFLVIISYALSARYQDLRGDMGRAMGIAVLLSVALRSWGSSTDVSLEGYPVVIGWILALSALFLFRNAVQTLPRSPQEFTPPYRYPFLCMMGMFANLTLVYLVFSCPLVVCAWIGYSSLGWSGVNATGAVAVSFAAMLLLVNKENVPRSFLACAWNALLVMLLAGGLFHGGPSLPTSPNSPPVFIYGSSEHGAAMFYLALLLSSIAIINVRHNSGVLLFEAPRNAVVPVMAGMGLFLVLSFLPVLSNVWGYIPFGHLFRNQFYLAFLLAGIGTIVPWLVLKRQESDSVRAPGNLSRVIIVLMAVIAVTGALVRTSNPEPAPVAGDLKVMTYNMQQGSRLDSTRNYARQLALLRRVNPDIIGLQECDTARPSGGNVDAVRYFAESLGYYAYYGPGSAAGTFGSAILSRYPMRNQYTFFTYSETDEIGTAAAEIPLEGRTVAFFSNHPAGSSAVMNAHVDALTTEVRRYEYAIALGDLNFTAREPFYAKLSRVLDNSAQRLNEADIDYHGHKPRIEDEIDHIFVSRNFQVLAGSYLPPPDSETDHPAHWSIVRLVK